MQTSIPLGRIAGIDIGVNWTWFIVVVLVVWSLSAAVFPTITPGLGSTEYLVMAVVAAVLFFSSLLAHELGHALQARRDGMEIDGITLWVFGGVAKFKGQFPSAAAELRIAAAGPAVSLVLGILFLVAALFLPLPTGVDAVVLWLAQINLILLIFNLLPALPLDGGRMLRAVLWRRRGDFTSATRSAAGLGRFFGQLMIFGGLLLLIFAGAFSGLWLAFIGWFLLGAAEAEERSALTRDTFSRMRVGDLMVRDVVTVPEDLDLRSFMDDVFLGHRHTAYPVMSWGGETVGLVTFRSALQIPQNEWPARRVSDVMLTGESVPVFREEAALNDVVQDLAQSRVNRALVLDGRDLRGLLSMTDVARVMEARVSGRQR